MFTSILTQKAIGFITLFCCFVNFLWAQAPTLQWQRTLGGSAYDQPYAIAASPDGNYVVAGYTGSIDGDISGYRGGLSDAWVAKISPAGAIIWQHPFGGSAGEYFRDVIAVPEGGYIAVGITQSNDGDVTNLRDANGDLWVVRFDENGNLLWQQTYGGTRSDQGYSIVNASGGGFVIAGITQSADGQVTGKHSPSTLNNDYWIIKIDASGTLLWQRSLGGSLSDNPSAVAATADGGYVVTGSTESNDGDVSGNHGFYDFWVVRLDASGSLLWQKALGGSQNDAFAYSHDLTITADGSIVIAGTTASSDGNVTINHGNSDVWVFKLDPAGNLLWEKTFGGNGREEATGITPAYNGGFIVAANTDSNNSGNVSGNHGSSDVWIVGLDNNGNLLWQKTFGGSQGDLVEDIIQSPCGYAVAAWTNSNDGDVSGLHGYFDYWVLGLSTAPLKLLSPVFNCLTGQLTLSTNGGNENPIQFHIPSLTRGWDSETSFTLEPKHRRKTFTVRARQRNCAGDDWDVVEVNFDPSAYCNGLRAGTAEQLADLSVRLMGNPVQGGQINVEVKGAEGQPLQMQVTSVSGHVVTRHMVDQAAAVERHRFSITEQSPGLLFLRVSTPTKSTVLKVLKAD